MNTDLIFIINEKNQNLKERFEVLIKDTHNFLFSETEKKLQCQKNQKLTTTGSPQRSRGTKILAQKSTSVLSDELFLSFTGCYFRSLPECRNFNELISRA